MDGGDLERFCRKRKKSTPLTEDYLRPIFYQILAALDYMHRHSILHRDIKPENILLSFTTDPPTVKVSDFGLAKHITSRTRRPYTSYVATRWYRAPELLLHACTYGPAVDLWAAAAVFAELLLAGNPLFPGSDQLDQIKSIVLKRGHPKFAGWLEGCRLADLRHIQLPLVTATPIEQLLPSSSLSFRQLIQDLLQYDPKQRPTAAEAMRYPFFSISPFALPHALPAPSAENRLQTQRNRLDTERIVFSRRDAAPGSITKKIAVLPTPPLQMAPPISLMSTEDACSPTVQSSTLHPQPSSSQGLAYGSHFVDKQSLMNDEIFAEQNTICKSMSNAFVDPNRMFIIPRPDLESQLATRIRSPAAVFDMRRK